MAELHLNDDQQQRLANLAAALGDDASLRQRFQHNVRDVFMQYGLGDLLPGDIEFEAVLSDTEVSGFALGGGSGSGGSHIDAHIDWAHSDINAFGGFRLVALPSPGRIA